MTLNSFLPALFSNTIVLGLVGGIGYLCRDRIHTYFTKRLQHKYDKELLEMKAEFKKTENQQTFIQKAALTALSRGDNHLSKLQINSINKLWKAFLELKKISGYAKTFSVYNLDKFQKMVAAGNGKNAGQIMRSIHSTQSLEDEIKSEKFSKGESYRPWLSPKIWAIYSAYLHVLVYILSKLYVLSLGEDSSKLILDDKLLEILKLTITDMEITSIQNTQLPKYLESLEANLINEIYEEISGDKQAQDNIKLAKDVAKQAAGIDLEAKNMFEKDKVLETNGLLND